jgi:uncharacterized membrane protein YgdD (TMEM256/DUF423 family)
MNGKRLTTAGALLAAVGVGLGAFGAHALEGRLGAQQSGWWQTATHYLLPHAVAVAAVGLSDRPRLQGSGWLLAGGASIFAGTLYAMALGAPRWLGAVTPVGGSLLILGWLLLAWSAQKDLTAGGGRA